MLQLRSASIIELSAKEVNEETAEESGPGVELVNGNIVPARALVTSKSIVELRAGGGKGKARGN
jgi:hypothetical protein